MRSVAGDQPAATQYLGTYAALHCHTVLTSGAAATGSGEPGRAGLVGQQQVSLTHHAVPSCRQQMVLTKPPTQKNKYI